MRAVDWISVFANSEDLLAQASAFSTVPGALVKPQAMRFIRLIHAGTFLRLCADLPSFFGCVSITLPKNVASFEFHFIWAFGSMVWHTINLHEVIAVLCVKRCRLDNSTWGTLNHTCLRIFIRFWIIWRHYACSICVECAWT